MISVDSRREKPLLWPMLLLVALILTVFWQVVGFDFVNFDDPKYVAENRHVLGGLSWDNVTWAWRTTYFSNWHPLTWLSYQLDAALFGKQAGGFHLTNLLLHTANSLLLFVVLRQLTGAAWKSAFVAALFAVHPLHVESVAWISERKGLLSTLFGFLALGAYGCYVQQRSRGWYLLSLGLFAASLLAKQMLVTLPFLLLLLDYWPLRRFRTPDSDLQVSNGLGTENPAVSDDPGPEPAASPQTLGRLLLEKVPFLALSVLFCVIIVLVKQHAGTVASFTRLTPAARCLNALLAYGAYLWQTFWPRRLAVYYPHPGDDLPWTGVLAAVVVLAGITAATLKRRRQHPYLLVGWMWFVGTLLPVIGIVQIGAQQRADRYTYFPLIGLFVGLTWFAASTVLRGARRRVLAASLAALALGVLAWIAHRQTGYWKDSVTLFERALAVTNRNAAAHNSLGTAYHSLGRNEEAIVQYRKALIFYPDYARAHNNLGNALFELGRYTEAIPHYRAAVRNDPTNALAHNNLGAMLTNMGRFDEARGHFMLALRIVEENDSPHINKATIHYNLGKVLYEQRRYREAVSHLNDALAIDPDLVDAYAYMGAAFNELGHPEQAEEQFRRMLAIDPDNATANFHLARLLLQDGKRESAVIHLHKVIRVRPDFPGARDMLQKATSE